VNTFNRIVMTLVILVLCFVVTVGLVVPQQSLEAVEGTISGALHTIGRIRPEFVLPFRALLILVALLVDVLLIGLLLLEIRGPAKRSIHVKKVGGGEVVVTDESLAERLQYYLGQLADVVTDKVKVAPRGGGVDLEVDVQTGVDVNVPEKAEQILQVTHQVVEDKMGLVMARKPRINIHAMPTPGLAVRPKPSDIVTTPNRPTI